MHIDNTEFVRRKTDYDNLCREIHLAYAELERINEANSNGKVYMRSFPACKEINLWTYWQGYNAMAPKILVKGMSKVAVLMDSTFIDMRITILAQIIEQNTRPLEQNSNGLVHINYSEILIPEFRFR